MSEVPTELSLEFGSGPAEGVDLPTTQPDLVSVDDLERALKGIAACERHAKSIEDWAGRAKQKIQARRDSLLGWVELFMASVRQTGEKSFRLKKDDDHVWLITSKANSPTIRRDLDALIALLKKRKVWDEKKHMRVPKPPEAKPSLKDIMAEIAWEGNSAYLKEGGEEIDQGILRKEKADKPFTLSISLTEAKPEETKPDAEVF